jgi:hypothetical protein
MSLLDVYAYITALEWIGGSGGKDWVPDGLGIIASCLHKGTSPGWQNSYRGLKRYTKPLSLVHSDAEPTRTGLGQGGWEHGGGCVDF